jgi:hypothetical protein
MSSGIKKQVVTTTRSGAHINSYWQGKGACLIDQTSSYVTIDAEIGVYDYVTNGQHSLPSTEKSWTLDFGFWSECNAVSAKHTFASIHGNDGGKLVVDSNLKTGSFHGKGANSTLTTEVCGKVCYTSNDDLFAPYCVVNNCTTAFTVSDQAVVSASWKAIGFSVNTTSNIVTTATNYNIVDTTTTNLRVASAKLSVKFGGISVHFPAAANLAKTGSLDHSVEESVYTSS